MIARRSPWRVQKVAPLIAAPEKPTATLVDCYRAVHFLSPIYRAEIAKYGHVSRILRKIETGILCSPDCEAEEAVRPNYSPAKFPANREKYREFCKFSIEIPSSFSVSISFSGGCSTKGQNIAGNSLNVSGNLIRLLSTRTANYLAVRWRADCGSGNPSCWRCSTQLRGSLRVSF